MDYKYTYYRSIYYRYTQLLNKNKSTKDIPTTDISIYSIYTQQCTIDLPTTDISTTDIYLPVNTHQLYYIYTVDISTTYLQ